MQLDKWQEEILNAKGHVLLCTGRQVGKTTIFARKAAERMIGTPGSNIIVVSLTEDQAQLMIIMTLDFLQRKEKELHQKLIAPGQSSHTKNKILLRNKSNILARPVGNTGDAVRGFTGDVLIVDEASRMPDLMWTAAMPTLATTGGEIWMCSTPFGKGNKEKPNYFYQCYLNKEGRFKVFEVNTWDVYHNRLISEGWTQAKREKAILFLVEQKEIMSRLQFGQEYMGLFMDDLNRLIDDDLVEKSCILNQREKLIPNREYYLGVDVARLGGDETTFETLDKINDKNIEHVSNELTKFQYLTNTSDRILELHSVYRYRKIGIDTAGVGAGVFDILMREDAAKREIVSIENAQRAISYDWDNPKGKRLLKEDMYQNFISMLEKGYLKLLNDDKVKLSLRSLQYEYEVVKDRPARLRIFGNYSHIVEGLIRAAWLAKEKSLNLFIDYI